MTTENVRLIREACPNLRDLTIDMRRESRNLAAEHRNDEICEELALFGPQLERVQIYFDLGIASIWSGRFHRHPGQEDSASDEDDADGNDGEMQAFPEDMGGSGEQDEARVIAREPITFKVIKPSKARHIEPYVEEMWQKIFGKRKTGPRALDVKIGEWEQKTGIGSGGPGHIRSLETCLKSFWTARPCVRDDMQEKCTIERHTLF